MSRGGHPRLATSARKSTAIAPNATALGMPTKTVAAALADVNWNGIGGFGTDDAVRMALFTASAKVGVREFNRPEDVEWNATTSQLFVAFTGHGGLVGLQSNGVLYGLDATDGSWDTARQAMAPRRGADVSNGTIMALEETGDDPTNTGAFTFWSAWSGRNAARFQAELTAGTPRTRPARRWSYAQPTDTGSGSSLVRATPRRPARD